MAKLHYYGVWVNGCVSNRSRGGVVVNFCSRQEANRPRQLHAHGGAVSNTVGISHYICRLLSD